MTMKNESQDVLPIPRYMGNGTLFYAQKFARSVDSLIAVHDAKERNDKYPNTLRDSYAAESADKGRLLVPSDVMDEMQYIAMAHGYGVSADELSPHNALWDEVLDSVLTDFIKSIDGDDAGYILSVSAHDLSRTALVRILTHAQKVGQDYRNYGWRVERTEDEDEDEDDES